ncbi:MFS-type efflux pump MSMEG_3705-like [Glandiceps talaboti]
MMKSASESDMDERGPDLHRRRPTTESENDVGGETSDEDPTETTIMLGTGDKTVHGFCSRSLCYAVYVLILLLIAYLLNQLDRYALAIVTQPMAQDIHYGDQSCLKNNSVPDVECIDFKNEASCDSAISNSSEYPCTWDYNGQGFQYQILAGPIFIVIYTFIGIPLGFAADRTNRKNLLATCLIFWSLMTLLTGFAQEYWHLLILRLGLGIGEAGCTPFATSLIADYFDASQRGSALGVYNWGIYLGFSLSFAVGNFITQANINGQGWRWVFWICGIPGIVHGFLIFLTLREPERKMGVKDLPETRKVNEYTQVSCWQKTKVVAKPFFNPSLLMICFAGSIRNGAGYVWAYNTQPYFNAYYPEINVGNWMSWIPLVSGSIGVVFGGFISDRVVKRSGPVARIWVVIVSLMVAAPFAALTLLLAPPWAFICQIPTYIFGEMWVGVTLAVIVELVPASVRTASVAVYFFIITNIGGSMPLLVPVLDHAINLRIALIILYPGMYVAGALLYLLSLFVIKRDIKKVQERESTDKALLDDSDATGTDPEHKSTLYGTMEDE